MFKTFVTLFRGAAAAAEVEFVDRNALLILDQQIRNAAGAVRRGKQALAIAVVEYDRERKRIAKPHWLAYGCRNMRLQQ